LIQSRTHQSYGLVDLRIPPGAKESEIKLVHVPSLAIPGHPWPSLGAPVLAEGPCAGDKVALPEGFAKGVLNQPERRRLLP